MAIDDPISALQALNDSDERQRPVLAEPFAIALTAVFPNAAPAAKALEIAADRITRQKAANQAELTNVLAEEIKYCCGKIQQLEETSEEHRRFMREDMPDLLLDALRRAETVRDTKRVQRLARVLANAAQAVPQKGADHAEEMMRVSLELSEREVAALKIIASHQGRIGLPAGELRPVRGPDLQRWYSVNWNAFDFSPHEVESTCGKLYGLGLLAPLQLFNYNPPGVTITQPLTPYELVQKGRDLLAYLKSNVPTDTTKKPIRHPESRDSLSAAGSPVPPGRKPAG